MVKAVLEQESYTPTRQRNKAIILFLATSGCRRSEVANLKVRDVDLTTCSARIYGGKGDKDRRIIISPKTCTAIKHYWKVRRNKKPGSPVFARHDKASHWRETLSPMSSQAIYGVVNRLSKLAGIEFTPHSFRHDCATKLAKTNMRLAQEQLGHASSGTTSLYVGFSQDDLTKAHRETFS